MKLGSRIYSFSRSYLLFAVLAWSLLILRFGYRFGTGDQVELLPYVLYLNDPSLYPHDFFIQGLHASVPNERTVMATMLLPFVDHLEICCFVLQFLTTLFLIIGLDKLARRFIINRYLAWLAILIALIPLNDFALGNVELYSECFQASALAVAIIVWGLNLFLDRKFIVASCLMSLATFIQLVDGLDVMLVLSAVLLLGVFRKMVSLKVFLAFISIYALTAGTYLFFIFLRKNSGGDISGETLFRIMFEFRHPHHFIFASFPKMKVAVFFLLALISVPFFFRSDSIIFQFIFISLAGVVVYVVAVDVFHNVFIGNFQFYKITQWMKFFGVVALIGYCEKSLFQKAALPVSQWAESLLIGTGLVLSWIIILNFRGYLPYQVPLQLFSLKESDDMISICGMLKDHTPKDAVFIQPFENTELKYYGQRSSYVEFKANVRNKLFVLEWMKRIREVYQVAPEMKEKGFNLQKIADRNYDALSPDRVGQLKLEGVTHVLVRKEKDFLTGRSPMKFENKSYAVYQL